MEKRLLLAMALCFLVVWLTPRLFPPVPGEKEDPTEQEGTEDGSTPEVGDGDTGGADGTGEPGDGTGTDGTGEPSTGAPAIARYDAADTSDAGRDRYETANQILEFTSRGGALRNVYLKEYSPATGVDPDPTNVATLFAVVREPVPGVLTGGIRLLGKEEGNARDLVKGLDNAAWKWLPVERADGVTRVRFQADVAAYGLTIIKTWSFEPEADDYRVRLTINLKPNAKGLVPPGRLAVNGPIGLDLDVDSVKDATEAVKGLALVAGDLEEFPPYQRHFDAGLHPEDLEGFEWVGAKNRFFMAAARPIDRKAVGYSLWPIAEAERYADNPEAIERFPTLGTSVRVTHDLSQGTESVLDIEYFMAPIEDDLLARRENAPYVDALDFGFFSIIAEALLGILHFLHSLVGNYGVAIIMLTLVVRGCLFPLSKHQQVSMQRYSREMKRIKPKLDALMAKYADDKTPQGRRKLNEERMGLFKKEGVSMVPAGCLVTFLQIPIFFALFQGLRVDIGLRHEGFLWAQDLTGPDKLLAFGDVPILPDYLNLFPILMTIAWFASAKMAPKSADPQQQQTQKMMQWMPLIFGFMLYNYQAGLAIYMLMSSLWSMVESRIVRKIVAEQFPDDGVDAGTRPVIVRN